MRVAARAADIDRDDAFPWDLYKEMGQLGLLGITVPEDLGGAGADEVTMCLVLEELARASGTVANAVLLAKLQSELISRAGTEDQRRAIVPAIVAGERICLIAVTEPGAGTDVAGIKTRAELADGGWVLNGTKAFMTAGAVGDVAVVLARTDREAGHRGFTTFLVEKSPDSDPSKGFLVGHKDELMGMRGLATSGIVLDGTLVPETAALGRPGEGFETVTRSFSNGRIVIASLALGLAAGALDASIAYAKERKAFGRTIENFQLVQAMIADMVVDTQAARLLIHQAARLKDQGLPFAAQASMARQSFSRRMSRYARPAMPYRSRRIRLYEGRDRRAHLPRRQADPDLRGHEPDPARHHRARRARPDEATRASQRMTTGS